MSTKLSQTELKQKLSKLDGWSLTPDQRSISKSFTFKDFKETWGLMAQIADVAESMDHHPNWSNVYNKLDITLNTHSCNSVTGLDLKLAAEIDRICCPAHRAT